MNMINVIVTDVGSFPAPKYLVELHSKCKLRKNGRVDGRTSFGKRFYAQERNFCEQAMDRYLAAQADAADRDREIQSYA